MQNFLLADQRDNESAVRKHGAATRRAHRPIDRRAIASRVRLQRRNALPSRKKRSSAIGGVRETSSAPACTDAARRRRPELRPSYGGGRPHSVVADLTATRAAPLHRPPQGRFNDAIRSDLQTAGESGKCGKTVIQPETRASASCRASLYREGLRPGPGSRLDSHFGAPNNAMPHQRPRDGDRQTSCPAVGHAAGRNAGSYACRSRFPRPRWRVPRSRHPMHDAVSRPAIRRFQDLNVAGGFPKSRIRRLYRRANSGLRSGRATG